MDEERQHRWWTSRGAIWVVLDRAVERGWGATCRLAVLLTVLLVGAHLGAELVGAGADGLVTWIADSARAVVPDATAPSASYRPTVA